MRVTVVLAKTGETRLTEIESRPGTTVGQVIEQADSLDEFSDVSLVESDGLSIWGKEVQPDCVVQDGDRVEVLRRLQHNPMDLRRIKQRIQETRSGK